MSKRAQIASRSRLARRPDSPPTAACSRSRSGHRVPDHSTHSASSAVPPSAMQRSHRRSRAARAAAPRSSGRSSSAIRSAISSGCRKRGRDQLARRPGQRRSSQLGALGAPQATTESSDGHRILPAERGGEQHLGVVGIDGAAAGRDLQAEQQRADGRVDGERDLVTRDLHRHTGGTQGPAQRRDHGPTGPDQHRHRVPGHAVAQVGRSEQLGDLVGLRAGGVVGVGLDPTVRQAGRRVRGAEGVPDLRSAAIPGARAGPRSDDSPRAGPGRTGGSPPAPGPGAGAPSAVRNRSANSRMPRTSAPRNAYTDWSGSPTTTRLRPCPATTWSNRAWAGSVSWYSSTNTSSISSRSALRRSRDRPTGSGCGAPARRSRRPARRRARRDTPRRTPPPRPTPGDPPPCRRR